MQYTQSQLTLLGQDLIPDRHKEDQRYAKAPREAQTPKSAKYNYHK